MPETTANAQTFVQKGRSFKLGKLTRTFVFGTENLTYTIADRTGERTVNIPYDSIDFRNSQALVTNNSLYRRQAMAVLFLIWSVLILATVALHADPAAPVIFSVVMIAVIIKAFIQTSGQVKKTLFKAPTLSLEVFQDDQHDKIVEMLKVHWLARLRNLHLKINPLRSPEQEIAKYEWLKKNDVISEQEFTDAVNALQRMRNERKDFPLPGEQKLN